MMKNSHETLVIHNAIAVLKDRLLPDAFIRIENGRIAEISTEIENSWQGGRKIDAEQGFVAPGFVDIHVHGGGGRDFMDGTEEAVRVACQSHLRHGTTTIFPTTTTGLANEIHAMIRATATVALSSVDELLPRIPGIHLYGPYFATDKVGCHSAEGRRNPTPEEYHSFFQTGLIRIATCAAELPGSEEFYRVARNHGSLITCGHSNASWHEMQMAFDAGMRHVDHFWCSMSHVASLRARFGAPMQASMEQFVLMNSQMSTEVIADAEHLSAELLEFAFRMIGPSRLCLVTDCSRALDMPAGPYKFGNIHTGSEFQSSGSVGLAPSGGLASSVRGMDHMVRVMRKSTSATLCDIFQMASLTPARLTGLEDRIGSLEVGKCADLLILDQNLNLKNVILDGYLVV